MSKKLSLFTVASLAIAGVLVVTPGTPEQVKAADNSSVVYKIGELEASTSPIGCVGCPSTNSVVPAFEAQASIGASIRGASEIDTFSTSVWDPATNRNNSSAGGCAIVNGGLKCWGGNGNGQLGNESTTDSIDVPVTATENGIPLLGITDVSSNGSTTCVVDDGNLKCVGVGSWPDHTSKKYSLYETINTRNVIDSSTSGKTTSRLIMKYYKQDSLINSIESSSSSSISMGSIKWVALAPNGSVVKVKKVEVGSSGSICVLMTDGTSTCSKVTAGTSVTISGSSDSSDSLLVPHTSADCDGLAPVGGEKYEKANSPDCTSAELGNRTQYEYRRRWSELTTTGAATWEWVNAGVTNAVDMTMPPDSFSTPNICFAGPTTVCRTFSAGEFGKVTTVENGENSEAVYITSQHYNNPGLCVYSNNTISCSSFQSLPNGAGWSAPTKVTAVAVMAKPYNVFYGRSGTLTKLYFLLPTGILATESWVFSCSNCGAPSSTQVVTPVTAFKASTASSYTYLSGVNGSSDSADYIPLTVISGNRKMRSSVAISVKTASGEAISGISLKWSAPDAPGVLSSSATSSLTTDGSGSARSTLPSGPVTFSLAPPQTTYYTPYTTTTTTVPGSTATTGGALSSGATLQAASISTLVSETGTVTVTVPDPPAIVQRKVSVLLPDGSPVPGATIQLKNVYLTYAYQNSGGSTSSWASRPRDTKGFLSQMSCAYCYVTPPKYATGSDGSVTFPSFDLAVRSSSYDADVSYDDGELNQNVRKTFSTISDSVSMPFMATIKASITDADPSTPETEVKVDSSGAVTVESTLVDEDNAPISDFTQAAEEVNADCEKGGLISSSTKSDSVCTIGNVVSASVKTQSLGAGRVKANSACSSFAAKTMRTNSAGKATLVLCPMVSTKYRIRGKGAVASRTFCVVVNGVRCGVSAAAVGTPSSRASQTESMKILRKNSRVAVTKYLKPIKGSTATYKVTKGKCRLAKNVVIAPKTPGICVITMTQVTKKTVKGKVKLQKSTSTASLKIT